MSELAAGAAPLLPPLWSRGSLVLLALRRRWLLALAILGVTSGLALGLSAALPKTWHVEVVLHPKPEWAGRSPMLAAALEAGESAAAPEEILAHRNLLELVRRTDLLRRWKTTRAPLGRLLDAAAIRLHGPLDEADELDALAEVLESRLYVFAGADTIRIGIRWPDAQAALDLVAAAQESFLAALQAKETAVIEEAIAILGSHAEDAGREVDASLAELPAREAGAALQPPAAELQRARVRAAVTRHHQLLDRLESARLELELSRSASRRRFEVVEPARLPRRPVQPRQLLVLLFALLGGALLATLAATTGELRAQGAGLQEAPARPAVQQALVAALVGVPAAIAVFVVGQPLAALAVLAACALAWVVVRLPLRTSALTLIFLMLSLPAPGDAGNRFQPFWAPLGHLLNFNLNYTLPVAALNFTGADVVLVGLLILALWRRAAGATLDDGAPLPRPLVASALATLGVIVGLTALGLASGGSFQQVLWQCHQLAFLPVAILLFGAALRGPADVRALGRVLLWAALAKAAQGLWVRYGMGFDPELVPTATAHGDSLLFTVAVGALVALFVEERTRRSLLRCLLLMPALLLAIRANNRRLAWIELAALLITFFLLIPRTRLKLFALRSAAVLLPVGMLYLAAGWNSTSRIFGPVAKIRSIVDSDTNRSTAERDVENFNLVRNLYDRPLLGAGFGHEYTVYSQGDDISAIFPQWRFIPHNSVLGLLAFAGILGFFGIWQLLAVGLLLAGRVYRTAKDPLQRAAALTTIGMIPIYLIQCYGDMGLVSWNSVFLLAPALAVTGLLASTTGAWPGRSAPAR